MGILTGFLGGGGAGVASVASYEALPTGATEGEVALAAGVAYVYTSGYWLPALGGGLEYSPLSNATGECLYDGPAGDDKAAALAAGFTDASSGGTVTDADDGGNVLQFSSTGGLASLQFVPTSWPDRVLVMAEIKAVSRNATSENYGAAVTVRDGSTLYGASWTRDAVLGRVGLSVAFNSDAGAGTSEPDPYTRIFFLVERAGASLVSLAQAGGLRFAGAQGSVFGETGDNKLMTFCASQSGNGFYLQRLGAWGLA